MSQRSPNISEVVFGGRDEVFAPTPPPPPPATLVLAMARSTSPCAMSRSILMPTCSVHGPDCNHTAGNAAYQLMKRGAFTPRLDRSFMASMPLSCSPLYRNPCRADAWQTSTQEHGPNTRTHVDLQDCSLNAFCSGCFRRSDMSKHLLHSRGRDHLQLRLELSGGSNQPAHTFSVILVADKPTHGITRAAPCPPSNAS